MKKKGFIVFIVLIVVAILGFDYAVCSTTSQIGSTVGSAIGSQIGKVTGFFEGKAKGEEEGRKAQVTKTTITEAVHNEARLEVLEMDIDVTDAFRQGGSDEDYANDNFKDVTYAELYSHKGKAIFSVDLSDAEVTEDEDSIVVNVTKGIEIELTPKEGSDVERIDTYQKYGWTGKDTEGADNFANSYHKVFETAEKDLLSNSSVKNQAIESAKNQITDLISAMTGSEKKIIINGLDD